MQSSQTDPPGTFLLDGSVSARNACLPWAPNSSKKALITLCNTSGQTLGFKILTNAPSRWCVRPVSGLLSPGARTEVSLALMAVARSPADLQSESDDRHLLLSMPVELNDHQDPRSDSSLHEESALSTEQLRVCIARLRPTHPGVSQIRLSLGAPASTEFVGSAVADAAGPKSGKQISASTQPPASPLNLSDAAGDPGSSGGPMTHVQTLVRCTLDELGPWWPSRPDHRHPASSPSPRSSYGRFKWKVYDIIFALLLLRLGRRCRPIEWLRRWLRELDA